MEFVYLRGQEVARGSSIGLKGERGYKGMMMMEMVNCGGRGRLYNVGSKTPLEQRNLVHIYLWYGVGVLVYNVYATPRTRRKQTFKLRLTLNRVLY